MKKTIRNLIYTIGILIVGLFIYLVYLGLFKEIKLETKELGPYHMAYQRHKGNYAEMYNTVDGVKAILEKQYKITCETSFGIYYDNPQKVETSKLRSDVGCIINEKDLSKIKNLPKTKVFEKRLFIVASFPYKSMLSIWLGLYKAYPAFEKEINQRPNLKYMMEIYDEENEEILYMMPIE